jgi:hypothetical protein
MSAIIRNVRDIDSSDRRVLEHVVGQPLKENQQLIIQVATLDKEAAARRKQSAAAPGNGLPPWCNVYDGLSDEEVDELERVILQRADLTRPPE